MFANKSDTELITTNSFANDVFGLHKAAWAFCALFFLLLMLLLMLSSLHIFSHKRYFPTMIYILLSANHSSIEYSAKIKAMISSGRRSLYIIGTFYDTKILSCLPVTFLWQHNLYIMFYCGLMLASSCQYMQKKPQFKIKCHADFPLALKSCIRHCHQHNNAN